MPLHRAGGLLDPQRLATRKIALYGLGSIGSLTAANLAYPFRQIVLVDPQTLAPENIERHLLGRRYLNRPKVEGVAEYLIDKGVPAERIVTSTGLAEFVCEEHPDIDLAIVNIDQLQIEKHVNATFVDHQIPALYGAVYPLGTGCEVAVIPTPADVCYECACHKMGRDTYQGQASNYGVGEYGEADAEPNYGAGEDREAGQGPIPALHWVISAVAADLAGFALDILSGRIPPPQILIRANQVFEPVLRIGSTPADAALTAFVRHQSALGLLPTLRIRPGTESTPSVLEAQRFLFSLALTRWQD